jgi:hypothetical protein
MNLTVESRLRRVEQLLGVTNDDDDDDNDVNVDTGANNNADGSLAMQLATLLQRWRSLGHDDVVTQFLHAQDSLEAAVLPTTTLALDEQRRVIQNAETDVRNTAAALERLAELTKTLDAPPKEIEELQTARAQAMLARAETRLAVAAATGVADARARVDALIDVNHEMTTLLSEQFVAWDAQLRRMERTMDEREKKE